MRLCSLAVLALVLSNASEASALGDWTNAGGNAGRNGSTSEVGPDSPALLWSGGRSSIIAWQPVIEGNRVFLVRQSSFIPTGVPNDSTVVARDLATGAELWTADLPYNPGEWTTWVAGAKGGQVYACRGGNGASSSAPLYALDAASGAVNWLSAELIDAGAYDGVVFAPNGDPVIGSFRFVWRIDATDGSTVWKVPRTCSVSGSCGVAIYGSSVYGVDTVAGGQAIRRLDLATGAFQYQSPVMPGFLVQNSPLVGPDGTVYFNRVQNNPATDFFYAFQDTGTAFVQLWSTPAGYNVAVEYTLGPDGSVYMMGPGDVLQRLDPATGAIIDSFAMGSTSSVRMATDALGRLFVSNGEFATGAFYSFEADLTLRWSTTVTNINIGGPALGEFGTLVIAGIGSDVRAYRNALAQDVFELSAATGGVQTLRLREPLSAGKGYFVLGSASGTSPGTPFGSVVLPLNFDNYTLYTVVNPNNAILGSSLGVLDPAGEALTTFQVPSGASLPGLPFSVNHAFLVVDFTTAVASYASNPSTVVLQP